MEKYFDEKELQELKDDELEQIAGGLASGDISDRARFIDKFLTARLNQADVIHMIRDEVIADVLNKGVDAAIKTQEERIGEGRDPHGDRKRAVEVLQKNMAIIKLVWH